MGKRQSQQDWQESLGMDMFEQALHQLDLECEEFADDPEQLLLAIGKAEHCYYVLFMSIRKHFPKDKQKAVRPPTRRFKRLIEDNLRDKS
jgi:hypothetical protein